MEVTSKRTDLLLEYGDNDTSTPQSIVQRKEECIKTVSQAQEKIDILKREISDVEREQKGITLYENGHVEVIDSEASRVQSESGKTSYLVNCKKGTCECKDHEYRGKYGVICGHRIADRLYRVVIENTQKISVGVTFASIVE